MFDFQPIFLASMIVAQNVSEVSCLMGGSPASQEQK